MMGVVLRKETESTMQYIQGSYFNHLKLFKYSKGNTFENWFLVRPHHMTYVWIKQSVTFSK